MDPLEQGGVGRVVGGPGRIAAYRAIQPAVHAPVNRVDPIRRLADAVLGPEGEREHGPDGAAHALDVGQRSRVEPAVPADPGRNQGMRELHQDRAPPAEHDDRLAVDAVRNHGPFIVPDTATTRPIGGGGGGDAGSWRPCASDDPGNQRPNE